MVREVSGVEGFTWGERLVADPDQRRGQATRWKYVAIYGFEGDVNTIHGRLKDLDAENVGSFQVSDSVHPAYVAWVYSKHQPLILHEDN